MQPNIDPKKCIGCGVCTTICPQVFEVKDGKAFVKKDAPLKEKTECIGEAAEACPVDAISIEE